jgi:hypothetical protein
MKLINHSLTRLHRFYAPAACAESFLGSDITACIVFNIITGIETKRVGTSGLDLGHLLALRNLRFASILAR